MVLTKKLTLYGFNNLTKSLSFNIYDICYAETDQDQREYIEYIDEQYNSERLTEILCRVTDIIGAHVLNISDRTMSRKARRSISWSRKSPCLQDKWIKAAIKASWTHAC